MSRYLIHWNPVTNKFDYNSFRHNHELHVTKQGRLRIYAGMGHSITVKPCNYVLYYCLNWLACTQFLELLNSTPCTSISEAKRLYPELFL